MAMMNSTHRVDLHIFGVLVVALSRFVVVPQHTDFIDNEGEAIFVRVRAPLERRRHSPVFYWPVFYWPVFF